MNPNLTTWHLVYTKPNCERKISQILTQKKFTAFCPSCSVSQTEQHIARYRLKPLFPTWVFVLCTPSQLDEVKKINGVSGVMYWKHEPAVISEEEISTIRYVVSRFEEVQVLKTANGVITGNESGFENTSVFPLPSLGYALVGRGIVAQLQVLPAGILANETVIIPKLPRYNASVRALLNRLPYLLGRKGIELPAPLSGELEQQ